jgi:hypothetical protein
MLLHGATAVEMSRNSQLDFNAIRADPDAIAEYRRLEEKAARLDI